MIKSIEHLAIASDDSTALARWYCDILGFKMLFSYEKDRTYFIGIPGAGTLEIILSNGSPRVAHAPKDPGFRHLALEVDDFDATYNDLKARGVAFEEVITTPDGARLVFFPDPDGNMLHLIWRKNPFSR
ncbi:MAG: VOC family protein [Armatimonadetes bacterium]|nr:VOC family protein [Armatimonadota bacterium]